MSAEESLGKLSGCFAALSPITKEHKELNKQTIRLLQDVGKSCDNAMKLDLGLRGSMTQHTYQWRTACEELLKDFPELESELHDLEDKRQELADNVYRFLNENRQLTEANIQHLIYEITQYYTDVKTTSKLFHKIDQKGREFHYETKKLHSKIMAVQREYEEEAEKAKRDRSVFDRFTTWIKEVTTAEDSCFNFLFSRPTSGRIEKDLSPAEKLAKEFAAKADELNVINKEFREFMNTFENVRGSREQLQDTFPQMIKIVQQEMERTREEMETKAKLAMMVKEKAALEQQQKEQARKEAEMRAELEYLRQKFKNMPVRDK